jgi:hypothetical protein
MKMLIEFTQLECGCPEAILETSCVQYKPTILTGNWVTEIWAYLALCGAKLEISGLWKPVPHRVDDNSLMEIATSSGLFTAPEMKELNRCRIFLQVLSVSDVVDIAGTSVEAWDPRGKGSDAGQGPARGNGRYKKNHEMGILEEAARTHWTRGCVSRSTRGMGD